MTQFSLPLPETIFISQDFANAGILSLILCTNDLIKRKGILIGIPKNGPIPMVSTDYQNHEQRFKYIWNCKDTQFNGVPSLVSSHCMGFSNVVFCQRTIHRAASTSHGQLMLQCFFITAYNMIRKIAKYRTWKYQTENRSPIDYDGHYEQQSWDGN